MLRMNREQLLEHFRTVHKFPADHLTGNLYEIHASDHHMMDDELRHEHVEQDSLETR